MPSRPHHATRANRTSTRIAAGIAATVLMALGGAYYLSYEPAPAISIRWREGTTWQRRAEVERRFGLVRSRDQDVRISYDLVDVRPSNIEALLAQPEIVDTGDLDLRGHAIPPDAPYGKGWMWIGSRLPVLRNRGTVPALIIACALVIAYSLAKELGFLRLGPRDGSRASRVAAAAAIVVLAALGGAHYVTSERAPAVSIRWRDGVSAERRVEIERQFRLRRPREPEGGTMVYDLVDLRSSNIEALLDQPEIEDTSRIDRRTYTIPANTAFGQGNMWIGTRLPILRIHGIVPAIVGACLIVLAYPLLRHTARGIRMRS